MTGLPILITLIAYKVLLLGIGLWASRRNRDQTDFFLGGRGLGPWVASISSAASSSSAWTLLGVSGAAYLHGLGAIWIFPACVGGFALNWLCLARPLRRTSLESGAVTVTELLAHDSPPNRRRAIVVSASLIVLLCLAVYVASQFQAAGKTFAATFEMDFVSAVLVGGTVVLIYTMLGGFWAVSVTDLIQGLVMAAASIALPLVALIQVGGPATMFRELAAVDAVLVDPFRNLAAPAAIGLVIGTLGIGLGYPGQPHVVTRFMALKDERALRQGRVMALGWAILTYAGMLVAGWCARILLTQGGDHEGALLRLTTEIFPPALAGIVIAAVVSAIMSTADSQLLVCGSTVAYDLEVGRQEARRALVRSRLTVVVLCLGAMAAGIWISETIFNTVLFAWSGLGAAFGPLLLVRVLRGPIRSGAILLSMWLGFVVTLVWFFTPAIKQNFYNLYELVPAFLIASVPAWLGSQPRHREAYS